MTPIEALISEQAKKEGRTRLVEVDYKTRELTDLETPHILKAGKEDQKLLAVVEPGKTHWQQDRNGGVDWALGFHSFPGGQVTNTQIPERDNTKFINLSDSFVSPSGAEYNGLVAEDDLKAF